MKIKENIKSISATLLGVVIFALLLFIPFFLIFGGARLAVILFPWLSAIMWIVFVINILILLPLSFFRKTRVFSGIGFFISSFVYGATLWFLSFLITYVVWGIFAVIVGLFIAGIGVLPIAMLASLVYGQWLMLLQLIILIIFTFGTRILGIYLTEKK